MNDKYSDKIALYQRDSVLSDEAQIPRLLWIFWWQGMDQAPAIVKSCYTSVTNRFPEYDIRIISEVNYKEYVNLPDFIVRRAQAGEIGMAHFSDLLRVSLLEEHGGIWMDATLFITEDFLDILTERSFCSLRYLPEKQLKKYVPEGRWSTFFLAGEPNHIIFRFCRELLTSYWSSHKYVIDYFLFDYVIGLGYDEVPAIRENIDRQPDQVYNYYLLNEFLSENYTEELFQGLITASPVYKLNHKIRYKDKIGENMTLYHYISKRYLPIY